MTALMVKCVFCNAMGQFARIPHSAFKLAQLPLSCSYYSCINKRTKTVDATFKTKNKGSTQLLMLRD
ncbi:Mobile element protein [Candidatus Enterovibrio altilux]|uniref:Mobile element protein n=1 Tax=Candidatus Enterovibrio altilux TaxID=1927128 RepID=A0A291B6J3_9GAMM|nr:Mobile element protein [Candidatus Enterovibrio luxaltus]